MEISLFITAGKSNHQSEKDNDDYLKVPVCFNACCLRTINFVSCRLLPLGKTYSTKHQSHNSQIVY